MAKAKKPIDVKELQDVVKTKLEADAVVKPKGLGYSGILTIIK